MAVSLGEITVSFGADLSGLSEGVTKAKEEVSSISDTTQQTQEGVSHGFGGMVSSALDFTSHLFGTVQMVQMAGQATGQFIGSLLSSSAQMEQNTKAFTTLTGSGQKATAMLQQLNSFAAQTPFQTQDIDDAASKMLAFGFNSKAIIPDLTDIGDALSALGKSSGADLEGVVNVFGQIHAAGKLMTGDVMQLVDRGIPAWQILSEAIGKPIPVIQKMTSQGIIPADKAIQMLTSGMEKSFGGGMKTQAESFNGLMSTIKSNITLTLASMTGPLLKMAEQGLEALGNTLSSPAFQQFASTVGQGIADALSTIGSALSSLFAPAGRLQGDIESWAGGFFFLKGIISQVVDIVQSAFVPSLITIQSWLGPLAQAVGNVASALGGAFADAMRSISNELAAVNVSDFGHTLSALVGTVLVNAVNALNDFANAIRGAGPIIGQMGGFIMDHLLGPLMHLGGAIELAVTRIAPLVGSILDWAANSGLMQVVLDVLGGTVGALVIGIGGLVDIGASLIDFLTSAHPLAEALRDVLIGVGVAMAVIKGIAIAQSIMSLIEILPMVIGMTSMWAAGMAAVAIETIIAAAPFIAIGAVVAVVVAGILLAINHWGEITKWLQGVWAAFSSWFVGALGATGNFFVGLWTGIATFFVGLWRGIVSGVQAAWGGIGAFFVGIGKVIVAGWQATVNGVVGAFSWMYNHNYYFKDLVDFIVASTTSVGNWLRAAWTATTGWLSATWKGISDTAHTVWGGITTGTQAASKATGNVIQTAWNAIVGFMSPILHVIGQAIASAWNAVVAVTRTAWNAVSAATQTAWNAVAGWVSAAWRTISGIISGAWNTYIAGPLGRIGASIANWFNGLAGQALAWGRNLIQGFINGIGSMLGAVGSAASNVAGTVAKFLGFHSPAEKGPGQDLDVWGTNLAKGFAESLQRGIPRIEAAVNVAAAPLAGLASPSSSARSSSVGIAPPAPAPAQPVHIVLEMDGHQIASVIAPHLDRQVRLKLGPRGRG